jgi:hypothetical protein
MSKMFARLLLVMYVMYLSDEWMAHKRALSLANEWEQNEALPFSAQRFRFEKSSERRMR